MRTNERTTVTTMMLIKYRIWQTDRVETTGTREKLSNIRFDSWLQSVRFGCCSLFAILEPNEEQEKEDKHKFKRTQ